MSCRQANDASTGFDNQSKLQFIIEFMIINCEGYYMEFDKESPPRSKPVEGLSYLNSDDYRPSVKAKIAFKDKRHDAKSVKKTLRPYSFLITLSTLTIIPILSSMPSEIVIFNKVTQQNIQTININYDK